MAIGNSDEYFLTNGTKIERTRRKRPNRAFFKVQPKHQNIIMKKLLYYLIVAATFVVVMMTGIFMCAYYRLEGGVFMGLQLAVSLGAASLASHLLKGKLNPDTPSPKSEE